MTVELPVLRMRPGRDERLRAGHPWVYANEIQMSPAARALAPGGVDRVAAPRAIVLRNDSPARELEGLERFVRVARGQVDGPIVLRESGIEYHADLLGGQKTGWFFDQRDNRRFVGALCCNQHVLDLYCHSGGFSIAAAVGGAAGVTAIDSS